MEIVNVWSEDMAEEAVVSFAVVILISFVL
jgi:hypothetical protein